MSFGLLLDSPFFTGSSTTSEVPGKYPIGINGIGYFLDEEKFSQLTARASLPVLRTQADQSNVPGLASLNPEDLWRRDVESWHHGAGQVNLDRESSDPSRFRSSKGIDVWSVAGTTREQITLLKDTVLARSSANTNLYLCTSGSRVYLSDGQTLRFTSNITAASPTWTAVTGTPAVTISSLASDGFKVYAAYGASGVYVTNNGTGAATQLVTTALSSTAVVGIAKARLMVGDANSVYNVTNLTGPAALPTALFTHQNTDWKWTGFAEGPNGIYMAGFSGDKSYIYLTSIKPDGTALDAPHVAGELPDGEVARSIQGYLGFMLVGTDKGVRLALLDAAGKLQFGRVITNSTPVLAFEPQDRFVWYGLNGYDGTSSGLGRIDLSVFTEGPLYPAYASDLMYPTVSGTVQSIITASNVRVFTISGVGAVCESTTDYVTSGTLDSGQLSYGIVDDKIAVFANVRHSSLPGASNYSLALSADGDAFTTLTSTRAGTDTTFVCNEERAEKFELRLTLTRDPSVATNAPVIVRETLRSFPSVKRSEQFLVPVIVAETHLGLSGGTDVYFPDVAATRQELFDLALSPQVVQYQEGSEAWSVLVKDVEWVPSHRGKTGWNGTATLRLLTVKE